MEIQRGARQGCVLSPDLFSLYSENIMEEIKDIEGIKIRGENINNLRYADDTVLIAATKENLQKLVNKLHEGRPWQQTVVWQRREETENTRLLA